MLKESEFKEDTKLFPSAAKVVDRLRWDPMIKDKLDEYNVGIKSG